MMLYPSLDELVQKVGSKYALVVAASKRARALRDGARSALVEPRSHKQVGLALEEIHQDLVRIEFPDGETRGS